MNACNMSSPHVCPIRGKMQSSSSYSHVFKHHPYENAQLHDIHRVCWLIKLNWKTLTLANVSLQLSCKVLLHSFKTPCHHASRQLKVFNCWHDFILVFEIFKQWISSLYKRFLDHFSILKWFLILSKNVANSIWCYFSCITSRIWLGINRLLCS